MTDWKAVRVKLVANRERLAHNRARLESTVVGIDRGWSRADRLRESVILRLKARLESLPVIEQAKGILIAESGCSPDEAFDVLRRASQRTNVKVRDLAAQIVASTQERRLVEASNQIGSANAVIGSAGGSLRKGRNACDDVAVEKPGPWVGDFTQEYDEASARMESRLLRDEAAIRRSATELQRAEAARQRAETVHDRVEAARRRALAARDRAHVALEQFDSLPGPEADERERIADEREAQADDREQMADLREAEADDREQMADQREAQADDRDQVADVREAQADDRERVLRQRKNEADGRERLADQRDAEAAQRERGLRQRELESDDRERKADERELAGQMHGSAQALGRATAQAEFLAGDLRHLCDQGARLRVQAADLATRMADQAEVVASYFERKAARRDAESCLAIANTEREVARLERQNAARLRDLTTKYERGEDLPRFPGHLLTS
jgi:sulfite oxidase